MTFANFLESKRITPNAVRGDFLADSKTLINCGKFPVITCWADLFRFMRSRNACEESIAEARKLWRQYQKATTLETVQ